VEHCEEVTETAKNGLQQLHNRHTFRGQMV